MNPRTLPPAVGVVLSTVGALCELDKAALHNVDLVWALGLVRVYTADWE